MGMMIFTMASGLTLAFGLMDVLNFGHGAFIALGAYVATLVLAPLASWSQADSLAAQSRACLRSRCAAAVVVCGALGFVFERVLIVPVYGQHLEADSGRRSAARSSPSNCSTLCSAPMRSRLRRRRPSAARSCSARRRSRNTALLATVVGLVVFVGQMLVLNRTKIGLLIRAGVENREMVEALGYRIDRLFVGVFMAGAALAGLGGVLWALYRGQVHASMGGELLVLMFIVIIIGGLGSVGGCFIGSILVALIANYAGFLAPKLALVSNILLMVAVLLWRPRGLYPVSGR